MFEKEAAAAVHLQAIQDEVFTFDKQQKDFITFEDDAIYPYLLVHTPTLSGLCG
jgi:hypothetical protein